MSDGPPHGNEPPRVPQPRKGQVTQNLTREQFRARFAARFADPWFDAEQPAIARLEAITWRAYDEARKAPRTRKAGPGYQDPGYDLSVEWIAARAAIDEAQRRHGDAGGASRVLLVNASPRNDHTCPGEMSKTHRLAALAQCALETAGMEVDLLDLSLLSSDFDLHIHPCKGCVSTAMPLCHWPCSCYPNHALGQVNDWMNALYPRWVACHGVLILTPVHWYQATSPLKLMMDRLVCADGGNPDPTATAGKDAARAKALELSGWDYPQHLAGRVYGVVVHGDVAGIGEVRNALANWLDWIGMIPAGKLAALDRYIGYYAPYATSHEALDGDDALHTEVIQAATLVGRAVTARRQGQPRAAGAALRRPRPK
ncbi:flavodoxin family protein [Cupriavidus sp. 30B13]|uniref:flavodoxin family protein n=1 Tax=Cupriavidus sp. 30B13 TaxID=3384241 RepID=UPI003B8FE324